MRTKSVITFTVATIILVTFMSLIDVYAVYTVSREGAWPNTWPKELEPLRNQSRTLGHHTENIHEIPFSNQTEFESAWPHILSIKSKNAPLILLSSPYDRLGDPIMKAGVRILSPLTETLVTPEGALYPPGAESAIPGNFLKIGPPWPDYIKSESGVLPEYVVYENDKWTPYTEKMQKEYEEIGKDLADNREIYLRQYFRQRARIEIQLIVDGDIVDLNRISLPADTPIIDRRFVEPNKDSNKDE